MSTESVWVAVGYNEAKPRKSDILRLSHSYTTSIRAAEEWLESVCPGVMTQTTPMDWDCCLLERGGFYVWIESMRVDD